MSNELSLTPMSEGRALLLLADLTGKPCRKLTGKGLERLLAQPGTAERLYVRYRGMYGTYACPYGRTLQPDDECSVLDLAAQGVKRILLRVNRDRDLITVRL